MTVLIIGGTGFIGRRLIPLLAQRGDREQAQAVWRPFLSAAGQRQIPMSPTVFNTLRK